MKSDPTKCDPGAGDLAELPPAVAGCIAAARDCLDLVALVGRERYAAPSPDGGASIGEHMRHVLDHLTCLFRTLGDGSIDYDARDRDPDVEANPDLFRKAIAAFEGSLRALAEEGVAGRPVRVRTTACPRSEPVEVDSTLERELIFVSSHTIHHLALARMLAERAGADVPRELGVAFSTAAHREREGARA